MEPEIVGLLIIGAAVLVVFLWYVNCSLDRARISRAVEAMGGTLVSVHWTLFGRGWLVENKERHYWVEYITPEGATVRTLCKTTLLTGVYWSGDIEVLQAAPAPPVLRCACGAALRADWNFCPNCGAARE